MRNCSTLDHSTCVKQPKYVKVNAENQLGYVLLKSANTSKKFLIFPQNAELLQSIMDYFCCYGIILYGWLFLNTNLKSPAGKRSLLRKSQRRKPKRTSKNLQTITTSKCGFKLITTTTSLHRNCLLFITTTTKKDF